MRFRVWGLWFGVKGLGYSIQGTRVMQCSNYPVDYNGLRGVGSNGAWCLDVPVVLAFRVYAWFNGVFVLVSSLLGGFRPAFHASGRKVSRDGLFVAGFKISRVLGLGLLGLRAVA